MALGSFGQFITLFCISRCQRVLLQTLHPQFVKEEVAIPYQLPRLTDKNST